MYIVIGLVAIVVIGIIVWRRNDNKKYNIPLIIFTPRSDGKVSEVNYGVGGYFKSKRIGGITSFRIRRKGIKTIEIPPPASNFLSAPTRTLMLVQKGVDDYEPVSPSSLTRVLTIEGRTIPILKLKAINQDATAWSFDMEETAKKRFTFMSFWDKYATLISMMMFVFILFLVLYINWLGMKDVVAGLKDVAEILRGTTSPIVTQGG